MNTKCYKPKFIRLTGWLTIFPRRLTFPHIVVTNASNPLRYIQTRVPFILIIGYQHNLHNIKSLYIMKKRVIFLSKNYFSEA